LGKKYKNKNKNSLSTKHWVAIPDRKKASTLSSLAECKEGTQAYAFERYCQGILTERKLVHYHHWQNVKKTH
jgi:hypothetical protein